MENIFEDKTLERTMKELYGIGLEGLGARWEDEVREYEITNNRSLLLKQKEKMIDSLCRVEDRIDEIKKGHEWQMKRQLKHYKELEAKYKATTEYKTIEKESRLSDIFEEILSNGINPTDETINRIYKKRYELKTNINVKC